MLPKEAVSLTNILQLVSKVRQGTGDKSGVISRAFDAGRCIYFLFHWNAITFTVRICHFCRNNTKLSNFLFVIFKSSSIESCEPWQFLGRFSEL